MKSTGHAEDADIVIISGSEAERITIEEYREILPPAAEKRALCFCTNPDIHKLHGRAVVPGAGSIAKAYEEMGGKVVWVGKPFPDIYEYALNTLQIEDRGKVICIGDSVEHDILGARTAGLASALVRTGILANVSQQELDILFETCALPDYVMTQWAWE